RLLTPRRKAYQPPWLLSPLDESSVAGQSLPTPKNFFAKRLSHKGYPLYGTEPDRFLSEGGMIKFSKWKVPLPGGQARRNKLLVSWGPLVIAAPLAGSLLAPLRCAAPCPSRARATWPLSRYPSPSQAAFVPFVHS